jgi:hypothetical protein
MTHPSQLSPAGAQAGQVGATHTPGDVRRMPPSGERLDEQLAKQAAAELWCGRATAHATAHGGKPWRYVLIPHGAVAEDVTLAALVRRFGSGPVVEGRP